MKKEFNIEGYTYKPIVVKTLEKFRKCHDGPLVVVSGGEERVIQTEVVKTNQAVNDILNRYASAIYTNEVNANSAIGAINEAKGSSTVKSVTLGTSIDFGVNAEQGVSSSAGSSVSVTIEVTDTSNLEAERRTADTRLGIDAANALAKVKTVATGSPDTPRHLTPKEINGLLQAALNIARHAARQEVEEAEQRLRVSESVVQPRQEEE